MKNLLWFISLILLFSCSSDESEGAILTSTKSYKIMPLGDSRVDGSGSLNGHQSYRYELWKNLIDNNWSFDFIGYRMDPANYPIYQNTQFDIDHAGYGGYRTSTILQNFTTIINPVDIPDIVLLGIGGNDLLGSVPPEQILENIDLIIDFLQALNPEIIVIIEQIAPAKSDAMSSNLWQNLAEFNEGIRTLTSQQTTTTSIVVSVDMFREWSDSYLHDNVHYTAEGAKVVADRYYESLSLLLENN